MESFFSFFPPPVILREGHIAYSPSIPSNHHVCGTRTIGICWYIQRHQPPSILEETVSLNGFQRTDSAAIATSCATRDNAAPRRPVSSPPKPPCSLRRHWYLYIYIYIYRERRYVSCGKQKEGKRRRGQLTYPTCGESGSSSPAKAARVLRASAGELLEPAYRPLPAVPARR